MLRRDRAWACACRVLRRLVFEIVDQSLNWAVVESCLGLAAWSWFVGACYHLGLQKWLILSEILHVDLGWNYGVFPRFKIFGSFCHVSSHVLEWLEVIIAFKNIVESASWRAGRCTNISQNRLIRGSFGLSDKFLDEIILRAMAWLWVGSLRRSCKCIDHEASLLLESILWTRDQIHLLELLDQRPLLNSADLIKYMSLVVWIFCLASCATHSTRRKIQRITSDLDLRDHAGLLDSLLWLPQRLNVLSLYLI